MMMDGWDGMGEGEVGRTRETNMMTGALISQLRVVGRRTGIRSGVPGGISRVTLWCTWDLGMSAFAGERRYVAAISRNVCQTRSDRGHTLTYSGWAKAGTGRDKQCETHWLSPKNINDNMATTCSTRHIMATTCSTRHIVVFVLCRTPLKTNPNPMFSTWRMARL
jgi:hypothetical protein